MKSEYQEAIERIDADRKRWMKTELMVDCQISGGMAETLIDEYFGKRENAPTFWIAKSRLEKVLSGEIGWPHVYTTDQSENFECVPLFILAETPEPAPHTMGDIEDRSVLWNFAINACAALIEKNIIMDTSAGKVLAPRQDGNRDGLHYATAIRELGTNHGCKSLLHPEYVTLAGDA